MAHIFQVGAGSGGVVVLDLLARDPSVTRVTLVEPDVYKLHNVHRHIFPPSAVGRLKAELAAEWVRERRPELALTVIAADLTDPARQGEFARLTAECDIGVCAVDNEPAKFAFDALMRAAGKPWTLGEVLSGGIGGWVHRFAPGGPCYGCLAGYLKRTVADEPQPPPADYSNPGGAVAETTVPAGKASIEVIAGLHAVLTLEVLTAGVNPAADFTSLLFTLRRVPGVFDEAFRPYRFIIPKSPACLICSGPATGVTGEELDVALGEALDRLGPQ
jgi:molybdopterin/thiamine biosynthesis adenylyltransferase